MIVITSANVEHQIVVQLLARSRGSREIVFVLDFKTITILNRRIYHHLSITSGTKQEC